MFSSMFAPLPGERPLFYSASSGERERLFVIFYSPFCFPPGVERAFVLVRFIAAPSSSIGSEESAPGFSQPLVFALFWRISSGCVKINHLVLKFPASVSCVQPGLERNVHLCPVSCRFLTLRLLWIGKLRVRSHLNWVVCSGVPVTICRVFVMFSLAVHNFTRLPPGRAV